MENSQCGVSEKRRLHPTASVGHRDWQRIHTRDRLSIFFFFPTHSQGFTPMDDMGWIALFIRLFPHGSAGTERGSRMGVRLYHSAPSKSRCESEAEQEYSPQETHTCIHTHTNVHCEGFHRRNVWPSLHPITLSKSSDPQTQGWVNSVPKGSGCPGETNFYL